MANYKNNEGYPDPTAGKAVQAADKPPEEVSKMIRLMKDMAAAAGFEVIGRIWLKDRNGREWK